MKHILFIFGFIFSCSIASACICDPLDKATKEKADQYDVIFTGKIDSVGACVGSRSIVYFTIDQLFRGESPKNIRVNIDCVTSCRMRMTAGEVWIVYSNYEQFGDLRATSCGRSRKYSPALSDDEGLARTGTTYGEELKFLQDVYGAQPLQASERETVDELKRELIKPKGMQVIWLLLASLAGMLVIWYVVKKVLK